jgi:hypothetical protein
MDLPERSRYKMNPLAHRWPGSAPETAIKETKSETILERGLGDDLA